MSLSRTDYARIVVNGLTDPGVLFNTGNMIVSAQNSPAAAAINASVAAAAFGTRVFSELKASGVSVQPKNFILKQFNKLADNRGAALMVSGGLTLVSAAVHAAQTALGGGAGFNKSAMLGCFGLVHSFRGVATGLRDGALRHALDASAFLAAFGGYMAAHPGLPGSLKVAYGGVAALAITMALRKESPKGFFKQPDIWFGLTSLIAATQAPSDAVAAGFACWGSGYLALDAMRKKGGVWQRVFCAEEKPTPL